jgi:hypothetical protein
MQRVEKKHQNIQGIKDEKVNVKVEEARVMI